MTTFTTEDREWAYWNTYDCPKYNKQDEIKFFWPLTEQMELNLDYGPTHLYYRAQGIAGTHGIPIQGSIFEYKGATGSTNITPSLSVTPTNSVGELRIGGISIGLDTKPNIIRRALHKLLGFNWKDK